MPKRLSQLTDLAGKRVLVRASFNVPMENGVIRDATRIDDAIPTIEFLKDAGAKVILMSHLSDNKASLKPIAEYLTKKFAVIFVENLNEISTTAQGAIFLLENIRRYPGEAANDRAFAESLASLADIYVNDDFTSVHREHASVVTLPTLVPSAMGLAFEREYNNLFGYIPVPKGSLAVIGGAKPETKIPLIAACADSFDHVYGGGVSANTIFEDRGAEIGRSLTASEHIPDLDSVSANDRIHWPRDLRIVNGAGDLRVGTLDDMKGDDSIVDAGPASVEELRALVAGASLVVWNGPLGDYERGYADATHALAKMLAESDTKVVVGGGDTLASIAALGLIDSFTFVSNAGGAMLHLFAHGSLPGVEALGASSFQKM